MQAHQLLEPQEQEAGRAKDRAQKILSLVP
jgi:hypothetical protein